MHWKLLFQTITLYVLEMQKLSEASQVSSHSPNDEVEADKSFSPFSFPFISGNWLKSCPSSYFFLVSSKEEVSNKSHWSNKPCLLICFKFLNFDMFASGTQLPSCIPLCIQ